MYKYNILYIYILSTGSLDLALQEAALTHIRHRDA